MSYWQLFHYECDGVGCLNKVTLVTEACASTKTPRQLEGTVDTTPRSPRPKGWARVLTGGAGLSLEEDPSQEIDLCPECLTKMPAAIGHSR